MNCTMARALKWSYFGIGINGYTEQELIEHLLNCPKCRKEYEEYAKHIGWGEFNIEDIAAKFKQQHKDRLDKENNTWMFKYSNDQVIRLAASKAIRQIMMSEKNEKFGRFLIKKICQKLDHLEQCYEKEYEESKNAKSK